MATLEVGNCTCSQEVGAGKICDLERSKGSIQVLNAAAFPDSMLASGLLCSLHSTALVCGNSSAFGCMCRIENFAHCEAEALSTPAQWGSHSAQKQKSIDQLDDGIMPLHKI